MSNGPRGFIDEIAHDIYRINIRVPDLMPGGFSFNQYLVVDERPLLFHTGPRKLFALVRAQIEAVLPLAALRYVAFSHVEADECGALPDFLAAAPGARPVCSQIGAMVSVSDLVDVEPIGLVDGQTLDIGRRQLAWQSAPHLPHGWDCGYLFEPSSRTLFCGDLFTQPGLGERALVDDDIFEASEAMRHGMDYYAHSRNAPTLLDKLAQLRPQLLACMHGSAWAGDGATLLRRLDAALARSPGG
ncbi:FprA family A-type flavoprotein [Methylibium sp.]|uniref:FprA family A-type flavoprotein n=1 Tax=Methylibium sp. TaxID=2067992 RepID=UPI00286B1FFE|nr:FprA family A-type flavoprotein [Methylibium sp.]